jgi:hypothetical protein
MPEARNPIASWEPSKLTRPASRGLDGEVALASAPFEPVQPPHSAHLNGPEAI